MIRKIPNLFFGPKLLDVVDNYTYLGVTFTFNGHFVKEKQFRYSNGCRATSSLPRKTRTLALPIDIQLQLFHTLVTPVVMYGAEVWGIKDCTVIERLHLKFCKYIYIFFLVIKSMLCKAECRVKWYSCISEILKSEFGVLQGGMLSPKLFTEFLQDISKYFDQGQGIPLDTLIIVYLLFADDLVLFSDSANGFQKQITALYK